jgi:hypothetical protein
VDHFSGDAMVCRRSIWFPGILAVLFTGIGTVALVHALQGGFRAWPSLLLYWIAFWTVLVAVIAGWTFAVSLRTTNWLLAISDDCCYLNIRSYLNRHFPGEPPVAQLRRREIRSIRSECFSIDTGDEQVQVRRIVIHPKDTSSLQHLARAVNEEKRLSPERRAVDFPVEVSPDGDAIHVSWTSISPRIGKAEARLRRWIGSN